MVKRSFYVLQVSPEHSVWPNHIVCLQSSPFIFTLESTIFLSMKCVLYCSVYVNSAQEVSVLSIPFGGGTPGVLLGRVRCCLVIATVMFRCKAKGVTSPAGLRAAPQTPLCECC